MSHKRSSEAKQKRHSKRQIQQIGHSVVLQWSWKDTEKVVGEIVFEPKQLTIVRERLTERFGYVPEQVLNHDFGEVLNSQ